MKNKNKKKILRFIAVFSIISILFVAFAFPISALDIGGGATLTGLYSNLYIGGDSEGYRFENTDYNESNNQIIFPFNLSDLEGFDYLIMSNYSYYSFNSSNTYGSFTFSIKILGGEPAIGNFDSFAIYNSDNGERITTSNNINLEYGSIIINFTGNIPHNFYVHTVWEMYPGDYPLTSVVSYNLSFNPRNQVADKLDEDKYPSFGDSQDKIDDSQQIEDDSLNNANGFIDSTADFVFDRSLWTEGKFINGLRIASTTFENFASIPFIGTILKYAVIFGLIGFVLGLATFVMRRRK